MYVHKVLAWTTVMQMDHAHEVLAFQISNRRVCNVEIPAIMRNQACTKAESTFNLDSLLVLMPFRKLSILKSPLQSLYLARIYIQAFRKLSILKSPL
jgi:hypothetical protein